MSTVNLHTCYSQPEWVYAGMSPNLPLRLLSWCHQAVLNPGCVQFVGDLWELRVLDEARLPRQTRGTVTG